MCLSHNLSHVSYSLEEGKLGKYYISSSQVKRDNESGWDMPKNLWAPDKSPMAPLSFKSVASLPAEGTWS